MTNLHPAQITIRRANANRRARQVANQNGQIVRSEPKPQTRQDIEAAINSDWAAKFPTYPLYHSLIKFYGVVLLRQLTDRQLREFHARIINA